MRKKTRAPKPLAHGWGALPCQHTGRRPDGVDRLSLSSASGERPAEGKAQLANGGAACELQGAVPVKLGSPVCEGLKNVAKALGAAAVAMWGPAGNDLRRAVVTGVCCYEGGVCV